MVSTASLCLVSGFSFLATGQTDRHLVKRDAAALREKRENLT